MTLGFKKSTAAPSSDPYEPVGTVPIVGDRFEYGGGVRVVMRIDPMLSFSVRFVWGGTEDGLGMCCWDKDHLRPLRILKRQKAPQAQAPAAPIAQKSLIILGKIGVQSVNYQRCCTPRPKRSKPHVPHY